MLRLEGQTFETWEPSKKQCCRKSGALNTEIQDSHSVLQWLHTGTLLYGFMRV